jgi:hypothetical protein
MSSSKKNDLERDFVAGVYQSFRLEIQSQSVMLVLSRVGNKKNHPKKPKKTHLKNPLKMFFFGFLNFCIFYENNKKNSL